MMNIKLETLTPVHIGSGETLQHKTDFVIGKDEDGSSALGIIDIDKVIKLIGSENIDKWVSAIERKESTDDTVKIYAPKASISDYSKRIISLWTSVKETDTLKEQIHDGLGRPYIPGSSIKGAIRTAVLSSLAKQKTELEQFLTKANAKEIERKFFGDNPKSDIFRFLQVGDAFFGNNYEIALRLVNINERNKQSFWDTSKAQLIEAIVPEDESLFRLKLDLDNYDRARKKVHQLPECMNSISALFQTINTHTCLLLEDEINLWEERKDNDESEKVDIYIEKINAIYDKVKSCQSGVSCILRIGHGSGWRFITGAWTEALPAFKEKVIPASRPNNSRYEEYFFPKTRRIDSDECELLGFVKLTNIKE